jgi:hypothetical protein
MKAENRNFRFHPVASLYHPLLAAKKKPRDGASGLAVKQPYWSLPSPVSPLCLLREHTDSLALFVQAIELYHTIDFGENRIVAAHPDVLSRMNARPELPDNDIPGTHALAAEHLDSPSLSLAVPPVARASAGFFMRHIATPDQP